MGAAPAEERSKSSNDISKDLVQSILREERDARAKEDSREEAQQEGGCEKGSSAVDRPVSSSSRGKGIVKVLQSRGTESVQQHMHPMDVARMQRHASNNVHVFARESQRTVMISFWMEP